MSWVMFKTKTTYFLRCKHPASFIRMVLFPLCLPLLSLFGRCWKHNTRTHRKETGIFSSNLSVNAKVGMSLMCWRKKASVHGVRWAQCRGKQDEARRVPSQRAHGNTLFTQKLQVQWSKEQIPDRTSRLPQKDLADPPLYL